MQKWKKRNTGLCDVLLLTCAQQHFAFTQVLDGLGHLAQTLLGQVGGVGQDHVEALRSHAGRQAQRLLVVVEDEVVSVGGEAAVVLQQDSGHPVGAAHHALPQLLVHTGRAHTHHPEHTVGHFQLERGEVLQR